MNENTTNESEISKTDGEVFAKTILEIDNQSPLYMSLVKHFMSEMDKARYGRICTPERMALLYPVFREINNEMSEICAEIKANSVK